MRMRDTSFHEFIVRSFVACAVVLTACAEEAEPPFEPQYETERLRIGTSLEARICSEVMNVWEAQIDEIEQLLGISRDFAWLYLYADDETGTIGMDCGKDVPVKGCWRDPVVRTTFEAVTHELVHAWTATVRRGPLPLLQEGIAVRMQGNAQRAGAALTMEDLYAEEIHERSYPAAGHFVAWLIATHGVERFMELYARSARKMTPAATSALFLDVLGSTAEEVVLDYSTHSKELYPGAGALACGRAEPVAWKGDAAVWYADGSCEGGGWWGFEGSWGLERVTIELTTSGSYVFDTGGREFWLTHCLTAPADESELPELPSGVTEDGRLSSPLDLRYFITDEEAGVLELPAGTYEVGVLRRRNEELELMPPTEMSLRKS